MTAGGFSTRRTLASSILLAASLVSAALHAAPAAPAKPAKPAPSVARPAEAPPSVELIESVPVETSLGNPKLRRAAAVWLELVKGATASLDFEEFYLSNWPGEPLQPILEAVVEAAKRGVRVRLLLDRRMFGTYPQPADSLGQIPGITVRAIDMGRIAGGVQHSKFFIVDGRIVYLGSQNMDWRALKHIHELGVCVRDPRVAGWFQQVFEMDWAAAEVQAAQNADSSQMIAWPVAGGPITDLPVRVVQARDDTVEIWPSWSPKAFSPDSGLWDRDAIVRSIEGAHSEVVLQLLQYSPSDRESRDDAIDVALRAAAARGVKVRMILSDWEVGGAGMTALRELSALPGFEIKLSRVPEWRRAYIPFARVEHCKYMVVDTLDTWVGTSNWEPGYFHRSRNVAVTMRNRPLARAARDVFQASWKAESAAPVRPESEFPPRLHGSKPPEGKIKYGE